MWYHHLGRTVQGSTKPDTRVVHTAGGIVPEGAARDDESALLVLHRKIVVHRHVVESTRLAEKIQTGMCSVPPCTRRVALCTRWKDTTYTHSVHTTRRTSPRTRDA